MDANTKRSNPWALAGIACLLALAACGTRQRVPLPAEAQPRASPAPAHPFVPRPAAPSAPGKTFPECDARAGDADREHVALGLLAGDCQDDRGRNRVYVTRLVTVKGSASPSGRAGIVAGDRIVRLDACEVASTHGLASQLRRAIPGWVVRVVVEREGKDLEVFVPTVRLAARGDAPGTPNLSTAGCPAIGRKAARP
jgi:hypothetical protein